MSRQGPKPQQYVAIAAIDFGTTCTGYAYNLRTQSGDQHSHVLKNIHSGQIWSGSAEVGLQAPTTVLMKPDKTFHTFGFEAEKTYKTLILEEKHKDWFYFRYFKMKLHHEQELSRDIMLVDAEGKKMKAMVVFSAAIGYVKNQVLEKVEQYDIQERDIKWVITVPAIWRNSAKQFMRESASKAGIPNERLILALEPESAAIYCKELALRKECGGAGTSLRAFDPGEKYIVVDCGGGTVDTTGHEVQKDGTLKELHAATGGPWGGQLVNEAFEKFIESMVTKQVFLKFRQKFSRGWIEFETDFEKKKRQCTSHSKRIELNFPRNLEDIFKQEMNCDLKTKIQEKYNGEVKLVQEILILESPTMERFFENAIGEIKNHIDFLLMKRELKAVSTLLLVGGFSESEVVKFAVRNHFKNLRVISPEKASVAILMGAVLFGYDEKIIAARISPYSYGVHTRKLYNSSLHDKKRKSKLSDGRYVVNNAFDKHIEVGEQVYVSGKSRERLYTIANRTKPTVFWNVYQSPERNPVFCDDPGCECIGKLKIDIPDHMRGERVHGVSLKVRMTCKGTELEAAAVTADGALKCKAIFDFLLKDVANTFEEISESIDAEKA